MDLFWEIVYCLEECGCDMAVWASLGEKQIHVIEAIANGQDKLPQEPKEKEKNESQNFLPRKKKDLFEKYTHSFLPRG